MNVLGLDLGGTCGFAYGPPGSKPASGTIRLDSKWPQGRRFTTLEGRIRNLIACYLITDVVVEAPYIQTDPTRFDIKQVELSYGYRAVVKMACEKEGIPPEHVYQVTADQWRISVLGRAKAPKEIKDAAERRKWLKKRAIEECDKRRWPIYSEDEAEACCILEYGWEIVAPASTLNRLPLFDQVAL